MDHKILSFSNFCISKLLDKNSNRKKSIGPIKGLLGIIPTQKELEHCMKKQTPRRPPSRIAKLYQKPMSLKNIVPIIESLQ